MGPQSSAWRSRVRRWWPPRGGAVTVGTAAAVVAALGLTALSFGAADNAVANYDASSWLWSAVKGEIARVNGVTSRVDTRLDVRGSAGHRMQVSQTDRLVLLRDVSTGRVSALDLATLRTGATMPTTSGLGVTVTLSDDGAFVVDTVQGLVRQLDPGTLTGIGEPLRFPPGITGGVLDGTGRLWVGVPSEGTVAAVVGAAKPTGEQSSGPAGPRLDKTVVVADPQHDLAVSALDDGVAVLDRTVGKLTSLRRDVRRDVSLPLDGLGTLPARISGPEITVTVPSARKVVVVADDQVRTFAVPGTGEQLAPAVPWAGRYYCPDDRDGTIRVLDGSGTHAETVPMRGANGPLELEVREHRLFINAPDSSIARVVDDHHQVSLVDKYADGVLGGDPPPDPPVPPPPPKPRVGPPGAPEGVTATAGDNEARVTWRAAPDNGSEIIRYVVSGAGRTVQVGARQRELVLDKLTNGQVYRFAVHAVNGQGAGPQRRSNPVVPTRDVPDSPVSVTAKAMPDGTVRLDWPAANGQGRPIKRYTVSAVSQGASTPAGATGTNALVVKGLEYGTQYAFTVTAVNDKGASSKPSPLSSPAVVPFAAPGAPTQVLVQTVKTKRGTVAVNWQPAPENGRPLTGYTVTVKDRTTKVPQGLAVTLGGFGDGERVTVQVTASNEAGTGPAASGVAQTLPQPTITALAARSTYSTLTVPVRTTNASSCQLSLSGAKRRSFGCSGGTVTGLTPGDSYRWVVYARNVAGEVSVQGSRATPKLFGKVGCVSSDGYCAAGIGIYSGTRQQKSEGVDDAHNGDRFQAFCQAQGSAGDQNGATIKAAGRNRNKSSSIWVKISKGGSRYIPWAWFNLENGDTLSDLPTC